MPFWGKDDYFTRWLHRLCAIPLSCFILYEIYAALNGSIMSWWVLCKLTICGYGLFFIFFRLVKYAFTGTDCINDKDS